MCVFSWFACDAIPSQLLYKILYLKSLQIEQTIVCFPNPTGDNEKDPMCADIAVIGCGNLDNRGVNCLLSTSGGKLCGVRGKNIITIIIIIIIINLHC